jgi:hypothetical protein
MTNSAFDKFVDEQSSPRGFSETDRQTALEQWRTAIQDFYKKVDTFLESYRANGKIQVERKKKTMSEDLLGQYETETYAISLGQNSIRLEPIGYFVIGAKGRIDMIGPRDTVRFVRVDARISAPKAIVRVHQQGPKPLDKPEPPEVTEWTWKIATKPPQIRYEELSAESFYDAVMNVCYAA